MTDDTLPLKHWPEPAVWAAVETVRRAEAAPEELIPTLLPAAGILADHALWTHANIARRIDLYFAGVTAGMDETGTRNEFARSEEWMRKSVAMASEVERLENELRVVRSELNALKADRVRE